MALIKVLHVDDDDAILEIAGEFLALHGITTHGVTDPCKVQEELSKDEYDVIISDYQMPGTSGIDLLRSLRKAGEQVPFILFTGKGREDVAIDALNQGADFFLQKGGDPAVQFTELSNMIRSCTGRTRQRRMIMMYTDIVDNVRSALFSFHLDQKDDTLLVDVFNPRGKKLIQSLGGKPERDRLEEMLPGIFSDEEVTKLKGLAKGTGSPFSTSWSGKLGSKMRFLHIDTFPLPKQIVGIIVNEVTERTLAEQRMNWAEEKFRGFFHNGYMAMCIVDNDTKRIVDVNSHLCTMYGYERADLIDRPITMLSDEPQATLETTEMVREKGVCVVPRRYHRTKDGTIKPVQIIGGRLISEGREMVTIIILDIAEIMDKEAKLHALSKAVENSPVTIIITNVQGEIEYVNPKFTSLTGYTSEEILGKRPGILSSGKTPRQVYEELWTTILNGRTWKGEFANLKKSGELYWESASISPILNDNGEITNFLAVKEDITATKALADQNAYLSEMITKAVNEVYSFNYQTLQFEFVNQTGLDNLGYTMEEMKRMTPLDLKVDVPRDDFEVILERLRSGRESMVLFETTHRRKNGEKYPVEIHLQIVSTMGEKKFLAILMDITYRKRMEENIRRLSEKAWTVSALTRHDIMNQVTVLLGNLELVGMEKDGLTDKRLKVLSNAARNIEHYLKFAEAFEKAGTVSPEWQDLPKMVISSWNNVGGPEVRMLSKLPSVKILADSMLPKVFDNLFVNSLVHGTGLKNIEVRWEINGDDAVIVYTDDGPGIPDDLREKLFKRVMNSNKGLGLFLSKEVLSITGMNIEERGEQGRGVRFEISVPASNWRPNC